MQLWRRSGAGLGVRFAGLGATALLTLAACDIEPEDLTQGGSGPQKIEYGTIEGNWVNVGDEVSVAALNPDSEEITANDLMIVDGAIHAAVVSTHREGTSSINPGLFVFSREDGDTSWAGEDEAVIEADLDAGEAFGTMALHTLDGQIGVTYTLYSDWDNTLHMATVGDEGDPVVFADLQQMGQVVSRRLSDSLVYTASNDDENDLWFIRSAVGAGGIEDTVEEGPETFVGTYATSPHGNENQRVRNWDFGLSSQRLFLVSLHDDDVFRLRVSWRQLHETEDPLTADDWSRRNAEFEWDTTGFPTGAMGPLPYNVRVTEDPSASPSDGGGVYIAVVHRERGAERNRIGQLFTFSRSGGLTPVGTRFFGPTGGIAEGPVTAGNLLEVFVTRQRQPVVVWNDPEVKAAIFQNGQWNLLGGPETGLTVDEGDFAAAAFDEATDTVYVMVNRQVYRFVD